MSYEEEHLHGVDASHPVDGGHLKKMKDKVKKMKDTITRKTHGHSDGGDDDDDQVVGTVPEVHGSPMYETTASQEAPVSQDRQKVAQPANLKNVKGTLEEDPAVPKPRGDQNPTSPYPPYTGPYGGDEMLSSSLEGMTLSDEQLEREEERRPDATAAGESAGRVAGKEPVYGDKIASTAKEAAAAVYGKVAEARTAVMGKQVQQKGEGSEQGQDRGLTIRGYLVEKMRPGEEDRALSEVILEAVQGRRRKEEGERGGGMGMAEKIRGDVTSLVGSGGGGEKAGTRKG